MTQKFQLHRTASRVDITFDDGGMNLLSREALGELHAIVRDLHRHSINELRALVTFASGRDGLFAAGADMAEMKAFSAADAESFSREGQELFADIEKLPVITAAVIDGDCFGGALDLAMAFDVRLATARSRFSHPGSRLGIVTGFGGTSRWKKITSRPAASALMIGNHVMTAAEALAHGLIDHLSDDHGEPLDRLAASDPATVRFVKELTNVSSRLSRSQLLLMARRLGNLYFG